MYIEKRRSNNQRILNLVENLPAFDASDLAPIGEGSVPQYNLIPPGEAGHDGPAKKKSVCDEEIS